MSAGSRDRPSFVYYTYFESTPDKVWHALTDADLTAEYWGHSNVSDWQPGSEWRHVRTDGSGVADVVGTVVESDPPRRLVTTWSDPAGDGEAGPSRVTFDIQLLVVRRAERRQPGGDGVGPGRPHLQCPHHLLGARESRTAEPSEQFLRAMTDE